MLAAKKQIIIQRQFRSLYRVGTLSNGYTATSISSSSSVASTATAATAIILGAYDAYTVCVYVRALLLYIFLRACFGPYSTHMRKSNVYIREYISKKGMSDEECEEKKRVKHRV